MVYEESTQCLDLILLFNLLSKFISRIYNIGLNSLRDSNRLDIEREFQSAYSLDEIDQAYWIAHLLLIRLYMELDFSIEYDEELLNLVFELPMDSI